MPTPDAYLLVEGKNDQHVVWALCETHRLPETFSVQVPGDESDESNGISALLNGLPLRLSAENLRILGIMVDADQNLAARWRSIREHLNTGGYIDVPDVPPIDGWISTSRELPRVGVWLMPDNRVTGMLEDFAAHLMPPGDNLRPIAEEVIQHIENAGLNRYSLVHHPKALIHTWLAWQKTPGMPMGQAITATALKHDSPLALIFVAWLRRLFEIA